MNKTAIVILNWNGIAFLRMFLGTVIKYSRGNGTVIYIADNNSSDGSVEWVADTYSDVQIIKLDKNYGFAGGYNLALEQIEAEYYVLLNSDIEVTEGWLDPLVAFMDQNNDVASCQPKILSYYQRDHFEHAGAAGCYIDKYGFPFCRGRILSSVEKNNGQYDFAVDIFWSSGACMIVRSGAWKICGGFDADFFAHMEEIDLCWRFNKAGYRVCFNPESSVYHVGGGSLPYNSPFKLYLNFRNSLFLLYKNLPEKDLISIMFKRRVLDGVASVLFLFQGKFRCFSSVIKAHISYYKSIPALMIKRETVKNLETGTFVPPILNKSIVFEFYIKGHRKFSSLKTDLK